MKQTFSLIGNGILTIGRVMGVAGRALVALIGIGTVVAIGANYTMTQGAGTTFASAVLGGANYVQMLICDATTANQCMAVSPTGTLSANVVSGTITANAGTNLNTSSLATSANQATNGASTAHTCSTGGFSELGCLGQIDDDVKGPITAGNALIGAVTLSLSNNVALPLGTSGGWTMKLLTGLLSPVVSIKSSAGQIGKVYCYNPNASVAYIQTFNTSPVTVGVTAPAASYGLGATAASGFILPVQGDQYNTSISAAATTTASGSTAPGTGIDCNVSFN